MSSDERCGDSEPKSLHQESIEPVERIVEAISALESFRLFRGGERRRLKTFPGPLFLNSTEAWRESPRPSSTSRES